MSTANGVGPPTFLLGVQNGTILQPQSNALQTRGKSNDWTSTSRFRIANSPVEKGEGQSWSLNPRGMPHGPQSNGRMRLDERDTSHDFAREEDCSYSSRDASEYVTGAMSRWRRRNGGNICGAESASCERKEPGYAGYPQQLSLRCPQAGQPGGQDESY
ncbi:hypothetical protein SUGI_0200550 [Cryptomeria japonica]|nr:hypothetical protein SUGI_0200550 [Cryptomeria japonica]